MEASGLVQLEKSVFPARLASAHLFQNVPGRKTPAELTASSGSFFPDLLAAAARP